MSLTSRYFPASILSTFFAAICVTQSPVASSAQLVASSAEGIDLQQPAVPAAMPVRQTVNVSQIRIVRLSQVRGHVQLDRSPEQKFEIAFTNLPIIAGEQLRTGDGVAEVEFEDNSSLRLTTDSQVDFPELGRDISGLPITEVNLVRGSLYGSLAGGKTPSNFTVRAGQQTLVPAPSSHFRIDTDATFAKLTVFQGTVTVRSDAGSLVVSKRKAVTFDLTSEAAPTFAQLDEPSPFDAWDKNAVEYHKALAVTATYANSPFSYGVNDLAYYGAFSNLGSCGQMWRPYLAGASFDPYSSGVWSWYPSSGYSWVSPYPWGWTPFHSGSWEYCGSGAGWGWRPDGSWNGLQNQAGVTKIRIPGTTRPHPPVPPVKGQPTVVGVNLKALQASKPGEGNSFVFHAGSAGIGVPRGVFNHLDKISQHAGEHGFATASVSELQATRGLVTTSAMSQQSRSAPGSSLHSGGSIAVTSQSGSRSSASTSNVSSFAASSATASSIASASHAGGGSSGGASHH